MKSMSCRIYLESFQKIIANLIEQLWSGVHPEIFEGGGSKFFKKQPVCSFSYSIAVIVALCHTFIYLKTLH